MIKRLGRKREGGVGHTKGRKVRERGFLLRGYDRMRKKEYIQGEERTAKDIDC